MPTGVHTAKNVSTPKRQAIVTALAHGEARWSIARRLHTSEHIVQIILAQEWQQVSHRKELLAAQAEQNALVAGNQIAKALAEHKYTPSALVPVYGVSLDKAALLRADPTIHVEHSHQHIHAHISDASYQQLLSKLPRRNPPSSLPALTPTDAPMDAPTDALMDAPMDAPMDASSLNPLGEPKKRAASP